jgi:hypothetical protein
MAKGPSGLSHGGVLASGQERSGDREGLAIGPWRQVLGFLDDLAAVYNASWFTLCPLWSGAGTNVKLLESIGFRTDMRLDGHRSPRLRGLSKIR